MSPSQRRPVCPSFGLNWRTDRDSRLVPFLFPDAVSKFFHREIKNLEERVRFSLPRALR